MMKKILFFILAFALIMPTSLPAQAAVCGLDQKNYDSAESAEVAGVEVSYDFACVNPKSETGLYEAKSDVNFAGMLVEVGSTDVPTTLIIRDNAGTGDYTVEVTSSTVLGQRRDQQTNLSDWIPGDQIRVIGKKNENDTSVTAMVLVNTSIKIGTNRGLNGWITKIDKDAKVITYKWADKEYRFAYNDDTRFVVGGKNPATADDLAVNDRIRGRLVEIQCITTPCDPIAKIVVVLRRGENLFMKIRTFRPNATLVRLDSTIVPTTIQVKIEKTPGLKAGDVNNLIGTEGALVTVNVTENTHIVRKYFGKTTLDEFSIGDSLHIIGRVNDDGTVDAKVIKNNSIWQTSTMGYPGVVTEVNTAENYIMVNWTPVKHPTLDKLKEKLEAVKNKVIAQTVSIENTSVEVDTDEDGAEVSVEEDSVDVSAGEDGAKLRLKNLAADLRNRVQNLKEKAQQLQAKITGQFERTIKYKKVVIERIQNAGVKIKDLIVRGETKKIRIDVTKDTKIVVGTNNNATISDIQKGDKVRIRGIKHASLPLVTAQTIVVVNSLPEIEEPLETEIDDVNEIVSEIVTDDTEEAIIGETTTETEEEIEVEIETEIEEEVTE